MNSTSDSISKTKCNQNIQVYVRARPTNARERLIKSNEVVEVQGSRDIVVRQPFDSRSSKKFSFDRAFGMDSKQNEVYKTVVSPLISEVLDGYNCTVFAYGQTGTGKTYTMIGEEQPLLSSMHDDENNVGMIPRALTHLFDELRRMQVEFAMRVSYLELYNEELCDLLSTDDTTKIRIFDDSTKKGSVIVHGLEEIPVLCKNDVYKLLAKGQERRKTAATLMNAQSSRSHTVFSILVHIKETNPDGEEMLKIGKLNLVDLAGSENISKAGNEKGIRTRESVNINQSLLTLGRVITALVERAPHVPYRESKLTRLLQESLGGRTKTSIIATISCGHKDLEETLSTLDYAHRAKNIQNKPEINQRLTKKVILKEYTEEIDRLKRDLMAAREKNGIYLATDSYNELVYKLEAGQKELNEKLVALNRYKDDLDTKTKLFDECSYNLTKVSEKLSLTEGKMRITESELSRTKRNLRKTERNFNEVKHLVTCHQVTEKKLTEHANEIIKVADMASSDTMSLQEALKRRDEKDQEANAASDKLLHSVVNSVAEMKHELQQMKNKHGESSNFLIKDLDAHMASNKVCSTSIISCLNELSELRKASKTDLCEKLSVWCENISKNDVVCFKTFINDISQHETTFAEKINIIINSLSKAACDLKVQESSLREFVTSSLNEHQQQIDNFTSYMQDKLEGYQKKVDMVSSGMQSQRDSQKSKIQEMRRLLTELEDMSSTEEPMNDLEAIKKDIKMSDIPKIEEFSNSTAQSVEKGKLNLQNNETALNNIHEDFDAEVKKSQELSSQHNDNCKKICLEQRRKLEEFEHDTRYQIKMLEDAASKQFEEAQDKSRKIHETIQEEASRTVIQIQGVKSVVQQHLHIAVQEVEHHLSDKFDNMTQQIDEFQKRNVFKYSSTGETPARKEYKFSRQLVTTSPHDKIIKRLRLEQQLSESLMNDTTLLEEDEISGENIRNSTPLKPIENKNTLETSDIKPLSMTCDSNDSGKENQNVISH